MLVQCAGNKDYVRHKKKKKKERKRKKRLPRQFRYAQGLNPYMDHVAGGAQCEGVL